MFNSRVGIGLELVVSLVLSVRVLLKARAKDSVWAVSRFLVSRILVRIRVMGELGFDLRLI
jgi:hypothetical protein